MSRGPLVFLLLVGLVVLAPLAHASPPDPVWIWGLYDAADYDDVVLVATSADSAMQGPPGILLRPLPVVTGFVALADAADPALAPLAGFRVRAPPLS